nr:winged helix-turn-helix domain-containing protein [Pedobacter sp. SYSU D00535]
MSSAFANNFFENIQVDMYSATPKYLQLAYSILSAIEAGKIQKNILLPSLNELSCNLEISRETADKGYKYLQHMGILQAIPGKGHYVATTEIKQEVKICLLINKISDEKKVFYDAFVSSLGMQVPIDFYVYNNDYVLFKKLLSGKADYSHYVIIPHFYDHVAEAESLINTIPKEKLILLDKNISSIKGKHGCIYENFRKDIYGALEKALVPLGKYETLKLVFPEKSYFPEEIIHGFNSFCQQYAFERKVICDVENEEINRREAYITLTEPDMITLIEKVGEQGFKLGEEVGLISYNETPLKKFILDGITTISTDYRQMGVLAAKMISEDYREKVELNFSINLRPSL